jgi:tryptophan halogenase
MNIDNIVIVGGGSAGWMTAATLVHHFSNKKITVIESPEIPTVGVGESTIESISRWLSILGIKDTDFMKETDASYKLSIKFTDFYKKGSGSFHYPFGLLNTDNTGVRTRDWYIKKALDPSIPVDDYALTHYPQMYMAELNRFSKNEDGKLPTYRFPHNIAYHFDAAKFGVWLRDKYCSSRGVQVIKANVKNADVSESGIERLYLSTDETVEADLFIDCTGFKSILLSEYLNEPFESYNDLLPNDSAIATRIQYTDKNNQLAPYTECTAIENGWVWNIPLWSRIGTGYVYSSKFVSDEDAKSEFIRHLNIEDTSSLDFKYIKMRVGIQKKVWSKNVCAIGLSAAFIEPLESTSLYTVHEFLSALVDSLQRPEVTQWDKDMFNYSVKTQFKQLAEFVAMHYALSQRSDTHYWRSATNKSYSDIFYNLGHDDLGRYGGGFMDLAHNSVFDWELVDKGIQSIAVGMNYFPINKQKVDAINYRDSIDVSQILKPYWEAKEKNKKSWKKYAEDQPTLYEYLKENIYND